MGFEVWKRPANSCLSLTQRYDGSLGSLDLTGTTV